MPATRLIQTSGTVRTIAMITIVCLAGRALATDKNREDERVILTPKPPAAPRINGARVFGVRPGRPFLFTIPATGHRPMRFGVDNLPAGLKVDPQTGQITGSIAERGQYVMTFRAKNVLGEAEREFRIVCGDTLALTPHMGWNSWYVWMDKVSDKIIRDAADAMVSTGLVNHGWLYVNIDDCWPMKVTRIENSDPAELLGSPRDARGNVRSNGRFPDMKALTDYIHSKGLLAGIYTLPSATTCAGYEGVRGHEQQDAQQFAAWGFDFLKYDWCGDIAHTTAEGYQQRYRQMHDILQKLDRDVVLNICQYGLKDVATWGRSVGGNSWRTAGDLGGSYEGIPAALFRDVFALYGRNELQQYNGPGGWNDPDYLLLGYLTRGRKTPLTPNEQYAHVSLWCLLSVPLILSGDITRLDDFTLGLLTNDEVIEIDQDPLGKAALRVAKQGELEVWAKPMEDGSKAVGLFNRGDSAATVIAKWSDVGVTGKQIVRDLWRQTDLGTYDAQFSATVGRHGVVLVRLRIAK